MNLIERDPLFGIAKEKFSRWGVDGVLVDLDDTLIYTSEIFRRYMEEYAVQVSSLTGIDKEIFAKDLSEINDREYLNSGVSPKRWDNVVATLAEKHLSGKEVILESLPILKKIYVTEPRMRSGAVESLKIFQEIGLKTALVTHANVEWTNWKMDRLGLWDYFDAVVIADENKMKKPEHWLQGAVMIDVQPRRCMVVGDNLKGDILSAASLGMKTAWMPSPWSVYREGEVPADTIKIQELLDLLIS